MMILLLIVVSAVDADFFVKIFRFSATDVGVIIVIFIYGLDPTIYLLE